MSVKLYRNDVPIAHVDYVDFASEVFTINCNRADKLLSEIGIMHQGPRATTKGKVILEKYYCFHFW